MENVLSGGSIERTGLDAEVRRDSLSGERIKVAMAESQREVAPPSSAAASTAALASPNQYHLHGGGIAVSYVPLGFGPVTPSGEGRFTYQDAHRSLNFNGNAIRVVDVPDLGTIVSVTIVPTVDVGDTTFSLLVPQVMLPQHVGASAFIKTKGITTVHRILAGAIGVAQRETYTVNQLSGTAALGILPA